jgi:hypothetical protein
VTDRWERPEARWLGLGVLLGAAAGSVVGALWGLLVFILPGEPVAGLVIGGSYGLVCGALVGLGVGAVVSGLVGRDRPRPAARRRATWAGLVVTPLLFLVVLALLGPVPVGTWSVPLLVVAALVGSLACRWVAGRTPDRPDVVRR